MYDNRGGAFTHIQHKRATQLPDLDQSDHLSLLHSPELKRGIRSALHYLGVLRRNKIFEKLLVTFYRSAIESIFTYVVHSLHPGSVEEASEVTCLSCCPLGGATGPSKPRLTVSEKHFLFTSHYCTNFTSVLLTSHNTTHVYMVVLFDLFSLLFILNAAMKEQLLIFLNI